MTNCRSVHTLLSALLAAFIALAPVARAQEDKGAPSGAQPEGASKRQEAGKTSMSRYSRVVEDDEGQTLKLEMAVHSYVPRAGDGPTIYLAGAVHVADRAFYKELQKFLDAKDIVLFEGVKPPGAGRLEHELAAATDEDKAAITGRRIRFLATSIERYRSKRRVYPESLDALAAGADGRIARLVEASLKDAWGNAILYTVKPQALEKPHAGAALRRIADPFEITSCGADAKPGGEDAAADIKLSGEDPLASGELREDTEGIQSQMAAGLGLVFQLDAMDHDKPNWRNSDLSIDQVQERLDKAGADTGELFSVLDGSSTMSKLLGFVFKAMSLFPSVQTMLKMMLVDMLAHADELLKVAPGGMGAMMDVIIKDRNRVVMDDLADAMKEEPRPREIAIIYGAGHLPDMEARLLERFEYKESGVEWLTAIVVDLKKTGMTPEQVKQTRTMMRKTIERQIKAAKRYSN